MQVRAQMPTTLPKAPNTATKPTVIPEVNRSAVRTALSVRRAPCRCWLAAGAVGNQQGEVRRKQREAARVERRHGTGQQRECEDTAIHRCPVSS